MLYPDLETLRRDSEIYEVPNVRVSNLERNCGQIFAKGPALTKDFLEKMNADIVPKKTYLFGRALNTKRILFISGLFLLLFIGLFGLVTMWFTDFFENTIVATRLALTNTSDNLKMWTKPTVKPTLSVYIFNYTNLEEFENKMHKKLRVQEIGPYVYEESLERVNIVFNDDDTVSYQEKRSFKFLPHLSKGRQNDRVTVPNIPLLAGAAKTKYRNYFERLAFSSLLSAIGEKPFVTLAADSLITGYPSDLYDISRSVAKMDNQFLPEKMGLLNSKIGVQSNVYTMHTGKRDISKFGLVEKINGKETFNYWSTEECDSVQGSDGSINPPKLVQQKLPMSFLFPQLCRTIPLVFQKEETVLDGKVPAYRYVFPDDIYDSVEEKPENQCYCSMESAACPLKGLFNATPCSMGAPMFVSHPHFYRADKSLFEGVSGLSAAKRDVATYLDLHPIMGFAMTGRTTLQLNVQVQKSYTVSQLDRYADGLMLPVAWFDEELKEKNLPQDYLDIIYDSTFKLKGVKLAFRWGFLLTVLLTLVFLVFAFKRKWQRLSNDRFSLRSLQRNSERSEEI